MFFCSHHFLSSELKAVWQFNSLNTIFLTFNYSILTGSKKWSRKIQPTKCLSERSLNPAMFWKQLNDSYQSFWLVKSIFRLQRIVLFSSFGVEQLQIRYLYFEKKILPFCENSVKYASFSFKNRRKKLIWKPEKIHFVYS